MTAIDILRAYESRPWTSPDDYSSATPLPVEEGDRVGVVLFNLGGPAALDEVESFLYRLLMDPALLDLPVGGRSRHWLAKAIAYFRASTLQEQYEMIGGESPVPQLAQEQARALRRHLQAQYGDPAGVDLRTYPAMRYGRPSPEEAAAQMAADGVDKVVLLPSYPQYSTATTGSALAYWQALEDAGERPSWPTTVVPEYAANPKYVQALSERIDEALQRFPRDVREEVALIFSAHDTVLRPAGKREDPYCCHVHTTVQQVMRRPERDEPFRVAFQGMIGPDHWLPSSPVDAAAEIVKEGRRAVLVVPFTFVTDHVNTRYELDVDVRAAAEAHGVEHFEVTAGLNTHPLFIEGLAEATAAQLNMPADLNQLRHGGDGASHSYPLRPLFQLPRHDLSLGAASCPQCGRTAGARRWTRPEQSTPLELPSDRPAARSNDRSSSTGESRPKTDSEG